MNIPFSKYCLCTAYWRQILIAFGGILWTLTLPHLILQANSAEKVPQAKKTLVVYDFVPQLTSNFNNPAILRRHYDEVLLVTCLQGIVNRNEPRLFVRYNAAPDDFWFARMREAGEWLSDRDVARPKTLQELFALFPNESKGLVVWDERVPATSNVAATIAGVEDLLAIRFDETPGSLYKELTTANYAGGVVRKLLAENGQPLFTGKGLIPQTHIESTGSAKNDAYIWLLENYIKPGKTNPRMIGYYIDADWMRSWKNGAFSLHTLNNLDYILAHRGVVCDLDIWEDETPVDDRGQNPGTDLETLKKILRSSYDAVDGKEMIACIGFTPWAFKYTNFKTDKWDAGGKHEGVATEWRFVEILSAYNAYMDADAIAYSSMVNASIYQHYPLPAVIPQSPAPTREQLIKKGILTPDGKPLPVNYYAHYQGDYDSAAWLYWQAPKMWNDPARGTLPLSWAMNPNLADRFAFGMAYIRKTRKDGEVWVAGEGAGYVMVSNLQKPRPISGLPDGLDVWVEHSKRSYKQWDIRVTGFEIDGFCPILNERGYGAFGKFSPGGVGVARGKGFEQADYGTVEGAPFMCHWGDLPGNEGGANMKEVSQILAKEFMATKPNTTSLHLFRSILQKPSYYAELEKELDMIPNLPPRKLVDMETLFWLIKEGGLSEQRKNIRK
ncbi:MAG: hypothetical protein B9S32_10000 [Verrucomicrobia bacterium Tous-C9LFEB]|nr:MAG: hypothetical protein B9S32_10000 [Verrucomicrobia bacterium Tous-C9LFEB]